jgi:hypothetical protein
MPFAECHYAECHYAECHYAECLYAECHYAECPGAQATGLIILLVNEQNTKLKEKVLTQKKFLKMF